MSTRNQILITGCTRFKGFYLSKRLLPDSYSDDLKKDVDFMSTTIIEKDIEKSEDLYVKYNGLKIHHRKIGVVGLGYLGLPIALSLSSKFSIVGFDTSSKRIQTLKQDVDDSGKIPMENVNTANILFTEDPEQLKQCNFIIVTVPIPFDETREPDLHPIFSASKIVGSHLQTGTIVVFEFTIYPGATEEVFIPILEEYSGLKAGIDFFVGFSSGRADDGYKEQAFQNIVKVVSGQDNKTLKAIAQVYGLVFDDVYQAPTIITAEASKVIENIQRDFFIAILNELAILFDRLGIDRTD